MNKILVLNAGSSSYKLALYGMGKKARLSEPLSPIWHGSAEWGNKAGRIRAWRDGVQTMDASLNNAAHDKALQRLVENALANEPGIEVIGHRIVHGGSQFLEPVQITPKVKKSIAQLIPLAPLHNPINLEGIELIEALMPGIPQFAVFDTAFHQTLSEVASTYPGPYDWKEWGIKRYGFHGISYQYCTARCGALLNRNSAKLKLVCCHLGNGSSVAAIANGKSVDTSMGFTPLDGLMMGTRCGSLDPGILLYLEKEHKQSAKQLFEILNHDSGLKGISGKTGDMREIIILAQGGNERARLAYDMYVHSLKRNIGSMVAVLGGIDALVFTGGIGENAWQIRHEACQALKAFGVDVDSRKNRRCHSDALISTKTSKAAVLVITAQEDWCVACSILKAAAGLWAMRSDLPDFKRLRSEFDRYSELGTTKDS